MNSIDEHNIKLREKKKKHSSNCRVSATKKPPTIKKTIYNVSNEGFNKTKEFKFKGLKKKTKEHESNMIKLHADKETQTVSKFKLHLDKIFSSSNISYDKSLLNYDDLTLYNERRLSEFSISSSLSHRSSIISNVTTLTDIEDDGLNCLNKNFSNYYANILIDTRTSKVKTLKELENSYTNEILEMTKKLNNACYGRFREGNLSTNNLWLETSTCCQDLH